ncbi:MAG: CGNR zinc finger domain-containing protein [Gemmatimonadota bacterium]
MTDIDLTNLSLVGGRPSLDFVNTEGGLRNGPPERLADYVDLARWSAFAGVIDEDAAGRLLRQAKADPAEAARVHARAIELREALFRVFAAVGEGDHPDPVDLDVLDRELAEALAHRRLVPAAGRFAWDFVDTKDRLDRILWLLVGDAADLLSSDQLERVKGCGGENCTWLFLDESRNKSRRWCEMRECGNRAKQRRYQRRQRKAMGTA